MSGGEDAGRPVLRVAGPDDAAVVAAHGTEGQSANGYQPSGKPAGPQTSDADPGD